MKDELRKKFLSKQDLLIKMRENEDIVYYKGFKLLEIKHGKNITFKIDTDTYKFNKKAMVNVYNSKIGKTIEQIYVDRRKNVEKYLKLKLDKIEIKKAKEESYKNNIKDIHNRISDIVKELKNEYSEYVIDSLDVNKILNSLEKNGKYTIKLNDKNMSYEMLSKLETFIMDKCIFEDKKHNNKIGLSKPEFNYKFNIKHKEILNNIEEFIKVRKESLDDYEKVTGYELEKRYQQDLMNKYRNKNIFPFELEYYTWEKDEKTEDNCSIDRGRIDSIFLNVDDNNKLKDIYMIELKVNENVVGGTNGVNKHFIDIYKLITSESNLNRFKDLLLKRLNVLRKLEGKESVELDSDLKLHFHTIISFANDGVSIKKHKQKTTKLLSRLNNEVELEEMKKTSQPIPKESKTISTHLNKLNNNNPICESKIYYNESYDPLTGKISTQFNKVYE